MKKIIIYNIRSLSCLGASEQASWRHQVYMTLTWTHSAFEPPGAKNWLDIFKKSSKSWSLIKRFFNFMRNPTLAHILVKINDCQLWGCIIAYLLTLIIFIYITSTLGSLIVNHQISNLMSQIIFLHTKRYSTNTVI